MRASDANGSAALRAGPDHDVVVVGAGFSGIGAAIALGKAGIEDFVILEQAGEIGGTWRDNTYPGVAVDIPSFSYQFSFEMNPEWSRTFAPGNELRAYADHCVERYGLGLHLRLNTRVDGMTFDEDRHIWRIETDAGEVTARFVITASGGLTQPKAPDIEGLDSFEGKVMHTARWDHDHDLAGKRVAVIGTGASAVQVVPAIAGEVDRLHVFQRTPIWVMPKPDYPLDGVPRRVLRHVPFAQRAFRLAAAGVAESTINLGIVYHRRLPLLARAIELGCKRHLRSQVSDPALRERLTPDYGFFCKRPSVSNDYLRTYERANTELVTEPIVRITPKGIRTGDGAVRRLDTLILATGFKVFEPGNTPPFPLRGRDGVELGDFWHEQRYQAYQGASVPGFPNAFAILGPYALTSSSWFFMVENQSHHAARVISEARRRGATLAEVRQDAHDRYFAEILRRQQNTIFFNNRCEGSNSYYFDRHGDAPLNRPSTAVEAWWRSRRFDLDHYRFDSLPVRPSPNGKADAALELTGRI